VERATKPDYIVAREIIERGKTPEAAQVFLTKQTWHRPASLRLRVALKAPPSSASTAEIIRARNGLNSFQPESNEDMLDVRFDGLRCDGRIRAISLLDRPWAI
jgi:hypothetical protein